MIHVLYLIALWFLSLLIAYKMGGANEQIRVQRVLRSALDEGDPRRRSVAGRGAPDASRHGADSLSPDSTDSESSPSSSIERGPRRVPVEGQSHTPGSDSSDSPGAVESSCSVLYDGEAEAALEPRPILSVVAGLEERPGLRVVEP